MMSFHSSKLALPAHTSCVHAVWMVWRGLLLLCHLLCCCSFCLSTIQERSGEGGEAMCTKPDGCRHDVCNQSKPNKTTAKIIRQRPGGSSVPAEDTTLLSHASDGLLTATSISPIPQLLAAFNKSLSLVGKPTQKSEACAKGFAELR